MYKTPGYGRRLRFVRKCRLVAKYILPVVLRTLFLSSMFRCCCCCSQREKERESTPSAHQRDNTHAYTHTHRKRERVKERTKKRFLYYHRRTKGFISVPRLRDQGNFLQLRAQFDGGSQRGQRCFILILFFSFSFFYITKQCARRISMISLPRLQYRSSGGEKR